MIKINKFNNNRQFHKYKIKNMRIQKKKFNQGLKEKLQEQKENRYNKKNNYKNKIYINKIDRKKREEYLKIYLE